MTKVKKEDQGNCQVWGCSDCLVVSPHEMRGGASGLRKQKESCLGVNEDLMRIPTLIHRHFPAFNYLESFNEKLL